MPCETWLVRDIKPLPRPFDILDYTGYTYSAFLCSACESSFRGLHIVLPEAVVCPRCSVRGEVKVTHFIRKIYSQ